MNQHQQIQAAQTRELARPEAEHSVVYGIVAQCLCPDHVWIKIGRSTQPQARLARLNTIIRKHLREDAFRPGPFSLSWQWPDRECIEHQPLALRFMMPGWRNTERLMRNLGPPNSKPGKPAANGSNCPPGMTPIGWTRSWPKHYGTGRSIDT